MAVGENCKVRIKIESLEVEVTAPKGSDAEKKAKELMLWQLDVIGHAPVNAPVQQQVPVQQPVQQMPVQQGFVQPVQQ